MADISLIDPYSAQQESIARQRRMAQALQQQAQTPLETPQTPGVLISPYAGLAKVLQGVYGGYQEAQADKEYKALAEEARTNQAADFASVIGALSAPGREGVAGQDFIADKPAVMAPQIEKSFGGYGMPREVGQYEVSPAVPGQPAIARQEPIAPGYISPELIASLKDPSMRQFAMAQAMAKLEPKAPISVAPGASLIDSRTFKPVFTAPAAAQRPVALSENQNLYDSNGKLLVTGTAKTASTTPHWEATTQEVAGKPVAGWINLNAPDKAASFVAGAKPAEAKTIAPVWKEVVRNGKIYYEDFNNPDAAARQAGAIEKEAVKTPPHYSEIENNGRVVIVDLSLPAKDRLANAQDKGPVRNNLEKIETNDANGRPVTRYVDKTELAKLGDIPQQYTGLLLEMAQAGQLKPGWESDPRIAGVIRDNLINQSGGITPAKFAELRVRIAEAAAKLAYEGVSGFSVKDLTPSLSNLTTLPSGSSAPAAPASAALQMPNNKNQLVNGQTYQTRNGPARWDAALGQFVQ
jgi:hypothetical protein